MDIQNEKYRLIQQIEKIQNLSVLKKIQDLLHEDYQENELSLMEQKLIEKGRQDFKENAFSTNDEVKERVKNRFNFT